MSRVDSPLLELLPQSLLRGHRFVVDDVKSWNVLLRPAIKVARRRATGSSLDHVPTMINMGLGAVIAMERYLPVKRLPGVSLWLRARRPSR